MINWWQWPLFVWLGSILLLAGAVWITVSGHNDQWDRAVVIGTCGGLPMVQREDGSVWLRVSSVRVYRIEDVTKLTCG